MQQYARMARANRLVFFDRCILDALSMFDQRETQLMEHQTLLTEHPYFRTAFSFPPWQEIYTTDDNATRPLRMQSPYMRQ